VITSTNPLNTAIIPFLAFNNGVREQGLRALWDLHLAYYYKGLSVMGSWSSGINSYSKTSAGSRPVHLPVGGYYAQVAYILTGETINDRVLIDPIRRFDLRRGKFGLGAFEIHSRFSQLAVGDEVFTQGLADRNLWTNQARMVDVGLNWYLNKWIRINFDWEHAMFAQPVYYRPGPGLQKTSDLFWMRFQLFF
jgi:phosphate-selective porin OprO/OprP